MKLYIQIENGQPVNHPALKSNLIDAFGHIPSNWAPFKRIDKPESPSHFHKHFNSYTLSSDGVTWQDTWTFVEMTDEEKSNVISIVRGRNPDGFPNTAFSNTTLSWEPTIPIPNDGNFYRWNRAKGSWIKYIETSNTQNLSIT